MTALVNDGLVEELASRNSRMLFWQSHAFCGDALPAGLVYQHFTEYFPDRTVAYYVGDEIPYYATGGYNNMYSVAVINLKTGELMVWTGNSSESTMPVSDILTYVDEANQ